MAVWNEENKDQQINLIQILNGKQELLCLRFVNPQS